ncbi:hypothetical protein BHE74_00004861 [Ensete ventricosum]|nr:hypothetical protein BHE74_00004861 [Ensete ventricosum]
MRNAGPGVRYWAKCDPARLSKESETMCLMQISARTRLGSPKAENLRLYPEHHHGRGQFRKAGDGLRSAMGHPRA